MSTPGHLPRRNPYRDPSAYWHDGVPPAGARASGSGGLVPGTRIRGEPVQRSGRAPSSASSRPAAAPRARKPASRLATMLGGASLGFGLMALTLGFVPWIGAVLAAGPLVLSVFGAWGSFARSRFRAARVSAMAIAGVALSALHVLMLFVR